MRMGGAGRYAIVGVVAVALLAPSSARADMSGPPSGALRYGGASQQGSLLSSCWVRTSGGTAVGECRYGAWHFPDRITAPHESEARILLGSSHRPLDVSLVAWAATLRGEPAGPSETLDADLERAGDDWQVDLSFPLPCRDYFMTLTARWWDEDSGSGGHATWQFWAKGDVALLGQAVC